VTAGVGGSTSEAELAHLAPMTKAVQPIAAEELQARIAKAQRLMREEGIQALYLDTSTNLRCFTGAAIPTDGPPVLLSPAFEEPKTRELMQFDAGIRTWEEHEDPTALVIETLRSMGVSSGTLAVDPLTPFR